MIRTAARFTALALLPASAWPAQEPPPVLTFGNAFQMLLGLAAVLALLAGAAWLLRRLSHGPRHAAGTIKIVASAAVGQRERVVLVEIGGTWLALGVAPGRVNALHTMPRGELAAPAAAPVAGKATPFGDWLWLARRDRLGGGAT
jgi:flagellar protein FliO/FliZ